MLFWLLLLLLGGGLSRSGTFARSLGGRLSLFCPNAVVIVKAENDSAIAIKTTAKMLRNRFITTCRLRVFAYSRGRGGELRCLDFSKLDAKYLSFDVLQETKVRQD